MCFKKLFRKKDKIVATDAQNDESAPVESPAQSGKIELEPEAEKESETKE